MANRTECFYGEPGTGKSEAANRVAELVATETGLTTRVLLGDGSRATYEDSGLIGANIAQVLDYTARDYPLSTLEQLCEGWWPEDVDDPRSPLVPPSTPAKRTTNDLSSVGVYIIEGLSVAGTYLMGDQKGGLAYRSGRGEKIGQDSPIRIVDGDVDRLGNFVAGSGPGGQFGANPPSHYNVAQRRVLTCVDRSKTLPMKWVIWTGHQRAVEDKISKEVLVGPEVVGGALTSQIQRVFNNTLHFVTAAKRVKGGKDAHTEKAADDLDLEYRIYTRDHYSPDGNVTFKYKACTRGVSADVMPAFLTGAPGEAIEDFYLRIKAERLKRMEATKTAFDAARAGKAA